LFDATKFSTWILVIFTLTIIGSASYSELFQSSKNQMNNDNLMMRPVKPEFLSQVNQIRIKNRINVFELKQINNKLSKKNLTNKLAKLAKSKWFLTSPNKFPINNKTLQKILKTISNIKITKSYRKDNLNLSNLSFKEPLLQLELFTSENVSKTIKLGFINPLDNSAFITISDHDAIFQITKFEYPLETIDLTDLIDTSIISTDIQSLSKLSLNMWSNKNKRNLVQLKKSNTKGFTNRYGKELNKNLIENFLKDLNSIKSKMILINNSKKVDELISKKMNPPLYELNITKKDGQEVKVTVTSILYRVYDLKVNKRQFFIIKSSDREYPYLVDRKHLKFFNVRTRKFK
jgi:hypothetical protein